MDLADFFSSLFLLGLPLFFVFGLLVRPTRRRGAATAKLRIAAAWVDGVVQTPQRPKIGDVLVKTKSTEKNKPNQSKTVVKMPIIRFLVSLPAANLS